jgi:ABC-type transport system involved in cytochrome bd biosynthesis fused ATPase/permease subunit
MMSQQFQQPEPPNKVKTFMKDVGWPILTPTIAGIIVFVATIWIGKIQIINFNWLMLLLALIQVIITVFLIWYCLRIIGKLQEKYQADEAGLRKEYKDYMAAYREYVDQEIIRWNERGQANSKEQEERLEKVKRECLEASGDVKTELTSWIQNNQTLWTQWTNSHANAHKWEQQCYQEQLKVLEEKLTDNQLSEKGN